MACLYVLSRSSSIDDVRYVGITRYDDASKRFSLHKTRLRQGSSLPLYQWMRKYEDVIMTTVLSNISWEEACAFEMETIRMYRAMGANLLNCTDGGEGFVNLTPESRAKLQNTWIGRKHSDEAKRKMSLAKLGKQPWNAGIPMSAETKEKLSRAHRGKTLSEETKKKIGESLKGRPVSERHRQIISQTHSGKIVSDATREKLSKANKGRVPPNKGKPMSDAQKKKLSESRKGTIPWNKGKKNE